MPLVANTVSVEFLKRHRNDIRRIDEVGLIELTDANIEEMQARINEAEEIFAAEAEAKRITIEWLNYEYTV
jgi:hypothetical protein